MACSTCGGAKKMTAKILEKKDKLPKPKTVVITSLPLSKIKPIR